MSQAPPDSAKDIVLSIPVEDTSLADAIKADSGLNAVELAGAGMDGGGEWLVFLVPLAHFTVQSILKVLSVNAERAKNVKLEVKGMTISGATLSEVADFLDRVCPKDGDE